MLTLSQLCFPYTSVSILSLKEKLTHWEENRETERRRLLMKEAEDIQQGGGSTSIKKSRNFFQNWISRSGYKPLHSYLLRTVSYYWFPFIQEALKLFLVYMELRMYAYINLSNFFPI